MAEKLFKTAVNQVIGVVNRIIAQCSPSDHKVAAGGQINEPAATEIAFKLCGGQCRVDFEICILSSQ